MIANRECSTLSGACAMVLQMSVKELEKFKPRTIAEKLATDYAHRAGRGDDSAFTLLTATADAAFIDEGYEDALSAALQEFADEMVAEHRAKHGW